MLKKISYFEGDHACVPCSICRFWLYTLFAHTAPSEMIPIAVITIGWEWAQEAWERSWQWRQRKGGRGAQSVPRRSAWAGHMWLLWRIGDGMEANKRFYVRSIPVWTATGWSVFPLPGEGFPPPPTALGSPDLNTMSERSHIECQRDHSK